MKFWTTILFAAALPAAAFAQDASTRVLAAQGDWVSIAHNGDNGLSIDVCLVGDADGRFAIRADKDNMEIRFSDPKWNLPSSTKGDVSVEAGKYSHIFHTSSLSNVSISSEISTDEAKELLSALTSSSVANLKFGTKTRQSVSLSGSTKTLAAFEGCLQQAGFADLGDAVGQANSPF